jgi:hypothetical protein
VQFDLGFIRMKPKKANRTKPKSKKTEPNQKTEANRKKLSQIGLNQFLSQKTEPNQNRLVWTCFGFFRKQIFDLVIFFIKTEPKIITPSKFYYISLKPFAKKTNTQTKFTCHYIASHVPLLAITRFHVEVADCNIKNSWPLGPIMLIT